MKHHAITAWVFFAAFTCLMVAQASAVEAVMGAGKALDCYTAAKDGTDPTLGIGYCDEALTSERLTRSDRAATLVNRGVMKIQLGQTDSALEDYHSGLELRPDLGDGYVDLGAALITLKRYDEAMVNINKGIDRGMTYPQMGYYNRGVAEEFQLKWEAAYADFKRALKIDPNFAMAKNRLKDFAGTKYEEP